MYRCTQCGRSVSVKDGEIVELRYREGGFCTQPHPCGAKVEANMTAKLAGRGGIHVH